MVTAILTIHYPNHRYPDPSYLDPNHPLAPGCPCERLPGSLPAPRPTFSQAPRALAQLVPPKHSRRPCRPALEVHLLEPPFPRRLSTPARPLERPPWPFLVPRPDSSQAPRALATGPAKAPRHSTSLHFTPLHSASLRSILSLHAPRPAQPDRPSRLDGPRLYLPGVCTRVCIPIY